MYWGALFGGLEAEAAAFTVLADAGKQWRTEVERRGGEVDRSFLSLIPEHVARVAMDAEVFAKDIRSDRKGAHQEGGLSMFRQVCLRAGAVCARYFGGKSSGWAKLRESEAELLDHELLNQKLVPWSVAMREAKAIEASMQEKNGAGQVVVAKKRRL